MFGKMVRTLKWSLAVLAAVIVACSVIVASDFLIYLTIHRFGSGAGLGVLIAIVFAVSFGMIWCFDD